MGFKDKMMDKAAGQISEKTTDLFNEIIRVQESMHAYLEKILEVQRLIYDEQVTMRRLKTGIKDSDLCKTEWKDE